MKALLALPLILAGCAASAPDWHWSREGSTEQEFNMDAGQCRAQAFAVPLAGLMQQSIVYEGCMSGKGWGKTFNR